GPDRAQHAEDEQHRRHHVDHDHADDLPGRVAIALFLRQCRGQLRLQQVRISTYRKYSTDSSRPGSSAPANSRPTDSPDWSAMITSMMLGGMMIPSVPPLATTPVASFLS